MKILDFDFIDSIAEGTMQVQKRLERSLGLRAALVAGSSILMAALMACSSDSHDVAGGVTDIGNSIASGVVLDVAGTPVKGARVVAYYDGWTESSIQDSVETVAGDDGKYELKVDSSASYVLFASSGDDCGFALAETRDEGSITVGPRRAYSGQIAGRHTGTVRIVGSDVTTTLDADGYFFFKDMPSGDITIVYTDSENPEGDELLQARVEFTTYGSRMAFVLPMLDFYQKDKSWLVADRGSYYEEGDEGIRIFVPDVEDWKLPNVGDSNSDSCSQGVCVETTLAYLGMDGTEVVYDNDSTLAATVDYVEGISGKAIRLKPGQFIDLDLLDPCTGDFTISLWTKWDGPNGEHQILASQRAYWSDSTSRFQWHFESARGKFMVLKSQPAVPEGLAFGDSSIVPVGEWVNLVLVSANNMVSMYVNGEVVLMKDGDGNEVSAKEFVPNRLDRKVPLRIGGNEIDTETWNGALDEIRIERVARSDSWIKEQYERLKP